jgi:large subunit ribosomal protein L13
LCLRFSGLKNLYKITLEVDAISYKTAHVPAGKIEKQWLLVDASSQVLGRLASRVASLVKGKHKTNYSPHIDCGDKVVVINADKVRLTGKKWDEKVYVRHTGYPGGQRFSTPRQLKAKSSALIIEKAVKGMLAKNSLGRQQFKNLFIYNGPEHPHAAQNPKSIKLT